MDRKSYEVHVTRDGKWWALSFPQLGPDAVTQAQNRKDLVPEARDYPAVRSDIHPDSFDLEIVEDFL